MEREIPNWRSALFVPVNVEKFVTTAHKRGADAVILDLEDSVPLQEKAAARDLIQAAAAQVSKSGADVIVRINRPWRLAVRDLEASVSAQVNALALPKVADPGHIRAIAEIVDELEAEQGLPNGHTKLIGMIETTDAFFEAREIARAHHRLVGLVLGSEDFALDAGMAPEPEGLLAPSQFAIFAARAAGIRPLGFVGSIAEFSDREKFVGMIRQARRLGYAGSFCIHPMQVEVCNEEFVASAAEVATARELIAAYEAAQAEGRGAIQFQGKMIDEPVVDRARRLVAEHDSRNR
jgi:citrate lyase subunit beta/citryl-CoA lyase